MHARHRSEPRFRRVRESVVRVWIVNPYGTLPSEGWREYRSAQLARALAARGHDVVWWIADFEHRSKVYREPVSHDPLLPANVEIKCLPGPSYQRHIGLGRIRFERHFGRTFVERATGETRPDVIVLAEPSLFFGVPVRKYAAAESIPLIVDVLDLWPELFHILLPPPVRGLGKLIFTPLYRRRRKLARQAIAIAAVTKDYGRIVSHGTAAKPVGTFYCGLDTDSFAGETAAPARPQGWPEDFGGITIVYAGTLGEAYDIMSVCDAARLVCAAGAPVRFLIAGAGTLQPAVEALARDFPDQVYFLGSIPPAELVGLYRQSDVGLISYAAGSTVSMPLKIFDYLAAGLAVLNSLDGEAGEIVGSGCGVQYPPGAPEALADAIVALASDPAALAAMKACAAGLGKQFDSSLQYGAFAEFIEDVVKNERAG